tara:strand:- start:237 stop:446 length:210 start_codon:yes stop_codon:yes gene_type:complete
MKLLEGLKFIDAFYNYVNNKINLNELENIIYSYKFKLIGFRFHKEKIGAFENFILIKSLETDQTFKLKI